MKLTPHFSLAEMCHSEWAARNGVDNSPHPEVIGNLVRLAERLEVLRLIVGAKPIIISSAYRSPKVNAGIGGSKTSAHMQGNAADLLIPKFGRPKDVVREIRGHFPELAYDQLILEYPKSATGGWVHFGCADKPRGQVLVYEGKNYEVLT